MSPFWLIVMTAIVVNGASLQSTRSYRACGSSDPETPRFGLGLCPSDHAYTRATVSVDVGNVGTVNISIVGTDTNRTRPGNESTACLGPFCIVVPNTRLTWSFLGARAQWSLNPVGFSIPYSYVVKNVTALLDGPGCTFEGVPDQLCATNATCDFGPPGDCSDDPACNGYGIATGDVDDGAGMCGIGAPLCYELCCSTGNTTNVTETTIYQAAMTLPMCQVYQAVGPPMFSSTINARVQNAAYNRNVNITGGIGQRVYGYQNDLRGFMRMTMATPSIFNLPTTISQGYFVVCDSLAGNVFNSTTTLADPPTCDTGLGMRWFYIPPGKTLAYGLGAHQYGESPLDVLQDMATLGCDNQTEFDLVVPGMRPNLNPNDPTSDYESPSPCTVLSMIDTGDPRSTYWLPPNYDTRDWQIANGILSVNVNVGSKKIADAFIVDVDIPTLIMPYEEEISPGYVDETLSRCYLNGKNEDDPSLIPGFLSPMICNPPVVGSTPAREQTYTVVYDCDPAVKLARPSDTVTMSNNQCKATNVAYNISASAINSAERVCNIVLTPGLTDPYPVQCHFGAVVPTPAKHCSVWSFGCNFKGENGGAWYRCIPFWIILAVVAAGVALLIWYLVAKDKTEKANARLNEEVRSTNDGRNEIRRVQ